jgi:serine/threonine protein kinase
MDRLIYESKKSKVFRREAGVGGDVTAVKVINYEFPTPADIAQFHNEYDIISGLRLAGVRNAIRKTRDNNRHVLEMEWVDGESLKSAFRDQSGDIVDVLYIFTACARALAEIHQHHIIHKDVSPLNILVDLQERRVWLIDFGISTNLDLKQPYVSNPELIEGTLAYCAPEQTGRMNRTVDFRADLYSLGVTFYEVLAGALPYQAADAMEMVHAHLAQVPPLVRALNPKVPAALSDIISKLLAKDPDDRYQSAHGLQLDLELCLTAFQKGGAEAALERAQVVQRKLSNNESFEALAEQHSEDPNFVAGGLLGTFKSGEFLKEVEASVQNLKPGDITAIVKSRMGFHIVKLLGKKMVTDPRFDKEKEKLRAELFEVAFKRQFKSV